MLPFCTPSEAQSDKDMVQTQNNSGPRAPSLFVLFSIDLAAFVCIYGFESGNYLYWFCGIVWYKFTLCLSAPKLNASNFSFQTGKYTGHSVGPVLWGPLLGKQCSEGICIQIISIFKFFFMNYIKHTVNIRQLCTQHPNCTGVHISSYLLQICLHRTNLNVTKKTKVTHSPTCTGHPRLPLPLLAL